MLKIIIKQFELVSEILVFNFHFDIYLSDNYTVGPIDGSYSITRNSIRREIKTKIFNYIYE